MGQLSIATLVETTATCPEAVDWRKFYDLNLPSGARTGSAGGLCEKAPAVSLNDMARRPAALPAPPAQSELVASAVQARRLSFLGPFEGGAPMGATGEGGSWQDS